MKFGVCFELYLVLCFIPRNSAHFEEDIQKIVEFFRCDPECTFNHSEVTSKTIKDFPSNCEIVCGILNFNSNTDLSEDQLKKVFQNLKELDGDLKVENSNLTSLSFFSSYDFNFCYYTGISIINNSLLEHVDILKKAYYIRANEDIENVFQIMNNTKLDASKLCNRGNMNDLFELKVLGNLKDCGCYFDLANNPNFDGFETCKVLYGGLNLTNITENSVNFSKFLSIGHLKGNIEVAHTNFKDLSFLKNLNTLQMENEVRENEIIINIHDNPEMTRLGWTSLEYKLGYRTTYIMNLENLHPDFCLSFLELIFFSKIGVEFRNIQATYCQDFNETLDANYGFCQFQTLSNLGYGCEIIFGDLVIDSNEGKYLEKLIHIPFLFGTLKIQYMKSEGLDFLYGLQYIVNLDATQPAITIRSNKYLKRARIPMLEHVISKTSDDVVMYENPSMYSNNQECLLYRITYQTNLNIRNLDCGWEPPILLEMLVYFPDTNVFNESDNIKHNGIIFMFWLGILNIKMFMVF